MIRRIFLTGLAAIIPFVITFYVIIAVFNFVDGIAGVYVDSYLARTLGYTIPGIGIILTLLFVFLLGAIIHLSRMRFHRWAEGLFLRIPFVHKIYYPVKQVINFLFFQPNRSFQKVVLLEYPRKGIYSLGFVTNSSGRKFQDFLARETYNVFIPSSPSPITGFMLVIPREELHFLDISVEQAIRLIVSGGFINPDELK